MTRLTIRARLTLVYGGLFLLAGITLLGVTYVLVSGQAPGNSPATTTGEDGPGAPPLKPAAERSSINQVVEETRQDTLTALLTQGGIALAVVATAATTLGWFVAGRMLRPLDRVTETARRIADAPAADRSLHERIALTGPPDEIKRLADTFDLMLARLDHSLDGQRRFVANASHELRTPLTLNRTLLEVAIARRGAGPEVRRLGETLLEINARHERLIEGLLVLANSDRELGELSYVDLADIVVHVVAQQQGVVDVHAEPGEAPTLGNPVLLERLVQNLVENGVRHNIAEGGRVHVTSTTRANGSVELVVTNTGPAVPRYEIPSLFEPFRRLTTNRLTGAGAGLGLSIVRAVAHAHGGEVHAEPREGGGLIVTVTLPGAPTPQVAVAEATDRPTSTRSRDY